MATAKKKQDPAELESRRHAELALTALRGAKGRALKHVAEEKATKREALISVRRLYDKLCDTFLRASQDTTYTMWRELVKPEWDELLAAGADDALWDHLTAAYERREHAAG